MADDLQSRVGISDSETKRFEFPKDFVVGCRRHHSEEKCEYSESEDLLSSSFPLKALEYFNSKEQTDFELVVDKPTDYGVYFIDDPILHINFVAQSRSSGLSSLFYAEVQTTSFSPGENDDIKLFGCSMLLRVDSQNPMGFGCDICDSETLIHPGPLSGYCVQKGDMFKESLFCKYRSYSTINVISFRKMLEKNKEFYTVCSKKAIQLLNSRVMDAMTDKSGANVSHATLLDASLKSICNWELLEVVAAMDGDGSAIHVNFTVKSSEISSPMMCFAELSLPEELFYANWTMDKEPLLEVRGCCIMKKIKPETQFGRLCGMCLDQLIHPGPAYDYCSVVGDDFAGKDFKLVGSGFF
ncbi:uncharacterized protein LOC141632328 [Silene latifolia]|uniref:uncharacterized protein LOC141632328 n=1 Tax=Silene latifolia TaxID=37657 RepID=UPI003D770B1E